jgi:pimeloyl-ACP methyl ester carboxylesterase
MKSGVGESRDALIGIERGDVSKEGYMPVKLFTTHGDIECRYCRAENSYIAAAYVGGVSGGFDLPANGLYQKLCQELIIEGISSLRVRFRNPTSLPESVFDLLRGLDFLEMEGIMVAGLVGHSFGGAVVIQAAVQSKIVRTVITLASQSYGAGDVADLKSNRSILLIHGTDDTVIPSSSSSLIYSLAHQPKRLEIFEGAGHGLDEVAEEVHKDVRDWLIEKLKKKIGKE